MADAAPAGEEIVLQALRNPVGTPPLQELAQGKEKAVIVVEDMTRPMDTASVLPVILSELAEAGLAPENVWLIMGLGAHTTMNRPDLIKKLGRAVVEKHIVYQNQPYENVEYLGDTERGTPVHISRFYTDADLRISLGSITPHAYAGFGGGAKTVAVGVAGIETLHANHGRAYSSGLPETGCVDGNDCRADMEEIARLAELHFSINGVLNSRRALVGLFAGDLVQSHRAAVELARQVNVTKLPPPADVIVFNAYPKDTNLVQSINAFNVVSYGLVRVLKENGTPVLATASPEGAGLNLLESVGMRLYLDFDRETMEMMGLGKNSLIIYSPNLSYVEAKQMYPADTLVFNRWEQVVQELTKRHGDQAAATVFPCASLQVGAGI